MPDDEEEFITAGAGDFDNLDLKSDSEEEVY